MVLPSMKLCFLLLEGGLEKGEPYHVVALRVVILIATVVHAIIILLVLPVVPGATCFMAAVGFFRVF